MFCCAGRASARRLNPEGGAKSDDERSPPREAHTAPGLSQANSSANPQQSPPAASSEARKLVILHFNDVYEIDPREREPVGGVARFTTALKSFEHEDPCVLFSGDFLAPSLLSTSTKGAHMVSFFNQMNIKAMCLGNRARRMTVPPPPSRGACPTALCLPAPDATAARAHSPRRFACHVLQMTLTTASTRARSAWLRATSRTCCPTWST